MSSLNLKKKKMRYDPEKFLRMEYNGIEVLVESDILYDKPLVLSYKLLSEKPTIK